MDVKTRWTLLGCGASLALAAVAILPPRPCDADARTMVQDAMCTFAYGGGAPHVAVAERTRDRLVQATRRRALIDSLLAARQARRVASGVVSVFYEAPLTADSARTWLEAAVREIGMLPGNGEGTPVIVVLRSDAARAAQRDSLLGSERRSWYEPPLDRFATRAHGGACVVTVDLPRNRFARDVRARASLLDWCALYGRYGLPGVGVARWATSAFALGWRDTESLAELAQTAANAAAHDINDFRVGACLDGTFAACVRFVEYAGSRRNPLFGREITRDVLSWLLVSGRHGEFARFWSAEGAFTEAVATGFARPAGTVLQAWARQRYAAPPRRPLGSPKVLLAGAVWFALAMAAAFVALYRREVR